MQHYELHINIEGIDAVHNLLKQVEHLQLEIRTLKISHKFLRGLTLEVLAVIENELDEC
jgi:hypothetical protein